MENSGIIREFMGYYRKDYGDTVGKYEMVSGVWVNPRPLFWGAAPLVMEILLVKSSN